jgi:hypothetical protein
MHLLIVWITVLLHVVYGSPIEGSLDRRAQCNADNVLRALQHRTPDSQVFCSSYISQPAATTVTVYTATYTDVQTTYSYSTRHPAFLYNLQRWSSTQTALKYATANPKPSTVPGGACYYPSGGFCATPGPYKRDLVDRAATPTTTSSTPTQTVPSYLATVPPTRISSACSCLSIPFATTLTLSTDTHLASTQTCLSLIPSATTILPAFCAPSIQVNAPTPLSLPSLPTTTPFRVPDKLSCCAACANVFNCVWWHFAFSVAGDPWREGKCVYAFNTGDYNGTTDWGNTAAVCPNGKVAGIDGKYGWSGSESANAKEGYNHGPCGAPVGEFQSSQDFGWPDGVYGDVVCPA